MSIDPTQARAYTDLAALGQLKREARTAPDAATVREAARQFESLFTRMMLKSMREASTGDSLFDSEQSGFYRDMFDDQLAVDLSRGRGLGLADVLVRQLMHAGAPAEAAAENVPPSAGFEVAPEPRPRKLSEAGAGVAPGARREFIERLLPQARVAARELGVEPAHLLAHAALETGWGRSMPVGADGTQSFNLFGIKATGRWAGAAVNAATTEFEGGVAMRRDEPFRAYASPEQSIQDYVALLGSSPRYRAALGTGADPVAFATALQRGGYATDPDYAAKLVAVAAAVRELVPDSRLKNGAGPPITASQDAGA